MAPPSAPTQNQACSTDSNERPARLSASALTELTPTSKQLHIMPNASMQPISVKLPCAVARQGRTISKPMPDASVVRTPPCRAISKEDKGNETTAHKTPHNSARDSALGVNCN